MANRRAENKLLMRDQMSYGPSLHCCDLLMTQLGIWLHFRPLSAVFIKHLLTALLFDIS